jgi:hypothetical protein
MTNPIDIVVHVHNILGTLATHFARSEGWLSFDDTLTLLLAILSVSPPINAAAIARFITKWSKVQPSKTVNVAGNYFIAAVEQIQKFNKC